MAEICVDVRGGVAVVSPAGDIDLATVPALRIALICLLYRGTAPQVIVDLRRADFLDSTGIGVLVVAQREGLRRGITVRVANAGPLVRSVLRMVGLYESLTAAPSLEEPRNAAACGTFGGRVTANAPAAGAV